MTPNRKRAADLVKELWEKHQALPDHVGREKAYIAAAKWFAGKHKAPWIAFVDMAEAGKQR